MQLRFSKYELFKHLALRLRPFGLLSAVCISRASHYCYPAANLEISIHTDFSAFYSHFQPQRTICASQISATLRRKQRITRLSTFKVQTYCKTTTSEIKSDSNEQSEDKAAGCPLLKWQFRRLRQPRDQISHSMQQMMQIILPS